jgi:tetratricopeptide (TPR) repeat protein
MVPLSLIFTTQFYCALRGAFFLMTFAVLFPSDALAQSVSVDVSRIGEASHFEFSGAPDWKYDLKRESLRDSGGERVQLRLPSLKSETAAQLRNYSDALVKSVVVQEKGVDGASDLTFILSPQADFFDYLTEQPSRLIIDFFPKDPASNVSVASGAQSKPQLIPEPAPPAKAKRAPQVKQERLISADAEASDFESSLAQDISDSITGIPGAKATRQRRKPATEEENLPPSLAERISEAPGFEDGIFDGGDPEFRRFTVKDFEIKPSALIASRANYYLPFPRLDLGNPQLKALVDAPPVYEIVPNESRENKEARVLANLFASGKQALLLKGAEEFLKKYPQSSYDEIIRYMIADIHFDFWREEGPKADGDFEKSMGLYQFVTERYPKSPVTPRTLLLMGYSYMDRGDSFGALKTFQRFQRIAPESRHIDGVKLAESEAYVRLNRFADASTVLDKLEASTQSQRVREEASYRKGDVLFRKREPAAAIRAYEEAAKKHPDAASRYPNVAYNTAEAQFNLGQYKEALNSYRKFLQKFPTHPHGGYAMTRIGEILGILGADPKKAQGAFLESTFRYRNTPGAGLARIRVLLSRVPEVKEKELAMALREIETITIRYSNRPDVKKACFEAEAKLRSGRLAEKTGVAQAKPQSEPESEPEIEIDPAGAGADQPKTVAGKYGKLLLDEVCQRPEDKTQLPVELPGIEEFSALLIADGLAARGEHDLAARDLIAYYKQNPQSPNKDRFKSRIVANLSEGIRKAVNKGNFIEALRRWSKDSSGWLKNTERIDVRFNIGRAYEQAGVFKESTDVYRDVMKRLADLRASGVEEERAVFETLPKADQIHLRLASVAARDGNLVGAESHLKNISRSNLLSEAEEIERAEISADVAEGRGRGDQARRYLSDLIKSWKGDPSYTSPLHLRIARLASQKRGYKEADLHLEKILEMKTKGAKVSHDIHAQALELRADNLLARGSRSGAVKAYRDLLTEYGTQRPLDSVRYRLGRILFEDGDLRGARAEWASINTKKGGLWAKLAQEQLQSAQWQNEYKKYLQRIPAASDLRDK